MNNTPCCRSWLLILTLVSTLTLSCEQHQSAALGLVANVNGTAITQADIAFAGRGVTGGHAEKPSSNDPASLLEGIILQELAYQKAVELGLDAEPKYLAELSGLQAQVNAFKRKKLSAMFVQNELLKKINISDAEAQQYFNKNNTKLRNEINVWQILSRNERTIKKIQAELLQAKDFQEVAAEQWPNLTASAKKPWDTGYLKWHQIPEAWQDVSNKMQIGDTSDIIRGPNKRFWIIKLIDKRENTDLTFEKIKPKIVEILANEKKMQLRDNAILALRENARIVYLK